MNADRSIEARLTNDAGDDSSASWAADGSEILFTGDRTGPLGSALCHCGLRHHSELTERTNADPGYAQRAAHYAR